MTRVMKYIKVTIVPPMIMSIENYVSIKCYIDEAFTVHKETRSHTGELMTMGTGGAYVQSNK